MRKSVHGLEGDQQTKITPAFAPRFLLLGVVPPFRRCSSPNSETSAQLRRALIFPIRISRSPYGSSSFSSSSLPASSPSTENSSSFCDGGWWVLVSARRIDWSSSMSSSPGTGSGVVWMASASCWEFYESVKQPRGSGTDTPT